MTVLQYYKKLSPKRFSAIAELALNDNDVRIIGSGRLDCEGGRIEGDYELNNFPDDVDPKILKVVLVTGYPSVCRESVQRTNTPLPFKLGDYRYERTVDFGNRGRIDYTAECKFVADELSENIVLHSRFAGKGFVETGKLGRGKSILESWTQSENGIRGSFDVFFERNGTQEPLVGHAQSSYQFTTAFDTKFPDTQRQISFPKLTSGNGTLSLIQDSFIEVL